MSATAVGLAALTVLCWGAGAIFDKLALGVLPPREVFIARLYLVLVLLLAPMALRWDATRDALWRADRRAVVYLAGSVIFTYSGMYVYYHALSLAGASKVVPFCAAYPVIAFLLAVGFLKEPFSATGLAGTFLVAGGAYLLSRS